MWLDTIFAPFVKERPICVMARAVLERRLDAQRLDDLLARTIERHSTRELLFASLVPRMSEVVLGGHPPVHAAYQAKNDTLGVSTTARYNKLARVATGGYPLPAHEPRRASPRMWSRCCEPVSPVDAGLLDQGARWPSFSLDGASPRGTAPHRDGTLAWPSLRGPRPAPYGDDRRVAERGWPCLGASLAHAGAPAR